MQSKAHREWYYFNMKETSESASEVFGKHLKHKKMKDTDNRVKSVTSTKSELRLITITIINLSSASSKLRTLNYCLTVQIRSTRTYVLWHFSISQALSAT